MKKFSLLLISTLALMVGTSFAQTGELKGTIKDAATKEPVPFAAVIVESGGSQVAGTKTDFDGNFSIKPLTPGSYDVRVTIIGYSTTLDKGVIIKANIFSPFNKQITPSTVQKDEVVVSAYKVPVFEVDQTSSGGTLTAAEVRKLPTRDINAAAATSAGVYANPDQKGSEGGLNIKGGRSSSTVYFVDGVKVRGSSAVPQGSIEQINVLTGGVPAEFGDISGGAVNITTKGPSRKFAGGLEAVTSEVIGRDGYNLVAADLSGPLLIKNRKKDGERALVGFTLSGEYQLHKDPNLPITPIYKVKDAKLKEIESNPLSANPITPTLLNQNNADFVGLSDLERIKRRQDVEQQNIRLSTKLNYQPTLLTTLTLGLSGEFQKRRNADRGIGSDGALFNSKKNGFRNDDVYRVFARYTQRFGQQADNEKATIKNAYYSVQADYSKQFIFERDKQLEDDFFAYGYVGKFTKKQKDNYAFDDVDKVYKQVSGRQDTAYIIEPGDVNPILGNYAQQYVDLYGMPASEAEYQANGGLLNGAAPANVYGLYTNVGRQVGFIRDENDQLRFTFKFSADIKKHSVQAGFEYEQRKDRFYRPFPRSLWTLMNQVVNTHLDLDTTNPDKPNPNPGDSVSYPYKPNYALQTYFDRNLRAKLNANGTPVAENEFIDVNSLDPSIFSVDMFTASDLFLNTTWNYSGYDYKGNKLTNKVNFTDFFTDTVNRPMGAFEPIYMAGYIQDKFALNDLIIRLGVRVDRFDANQSVLKDKYSLFPTKSRGEVDGALNKKNGGSHPGNIGDDFVVYVKGTQREGGNDDVEITGYRSGDKFFNANGEQVETADELNDANGNVVPLFSDQVKLDDNRPDFNSSAAAAFTDYKPQVTVQPRVSFSFPISDEAVFFANYDVLAQRPQTAGAGRNFVYSSPVDYFLLARGRNSTLANPNIKPEITVDYQLGFKQKLTQSSALSITSFYREFRDQIRQISVFNAYPADYATYDNGDFSTVKGLTLDYDMRRTGNTSLRLSYTLQFADGTGSSATSAQNLLSSGQGNILIPNALNFDQRHTVVANLDYRYGSDKDYNGPQALRKLLNGAGANFIFRTGSGTPYSRQREFTRLGADNRFRTLVGSTNGSRLPWTYTIDARFDKDILIGQKKANRSSKNPSYLNIYLQIQNVLNTQNIIDVYNTTGNADDDGYLTTSTGIKDVQVQTNAEAFVDLYRIKMNDPRNYAPPRLIRLGATFNF